MKEQTLGDFIADSLDIEKFQKRIESLNKQPHKGHLCDACGLYFDEGDIYPVDGKYLCIRCMDDRDKIREEENERQNSEN